MLGGRPPPAPAPSIVSTPASPTRQETVYKADCPGRHVCDQVADKWSMLILAVLDGGPQRFNVIRRRLEGVTQKALTQALRRLERNGIVAREVLPASPVGVEYRLTPLGRSLQETFLRFYAWTVAHHEEISRAQAEFDRRQAG